MAVQVEAKSGGQSALSRFASYSAVLIAVGVAGIVGIMIIPLPPALLDVLITINISAALAVLLITMYTLRPLDFSVLPSLLLIATLLRLGINISATRLILLDAHAGAVIQAFGNFVVGGNYVVGVVIFLILVVIQFVVITKGAERVAEVGARFTLDAMPGKQMSIDADLNAGLINEEQARQRRRDIEREADFYGAMDGASKFVKGDAIAGILIIFVNIIGGLFIGVLQKGMPIIEALETYTLLTVGDGLVSQIAAILLSTATGIIVTRAASDANLGQDVTKQLGASPRALVIVAGLLFCLGLVPGLPKLPFFVIGALLGGVYLVQRGRKPAADLAVVEGPTRPADPNDSESLRGLLKVDPIELELGYGLIGLADPDESGNLLGRVGLIRRQIALELGIIMPTIRIHDNAQLPTNAYAIKLRGLPGGGGTARPGYFMAMNPGTADVPIDGIETTEPAFGLPALWIDPHQKEQAEIFGYTVVDPASVIVTHLIEVLKRNAASILGRQDVQALVDGVKAEYPSLIAELTPDPLSVGEVQRVLQNLLAEGVSIRDTVAIFEALTDQARIVKDPDALSEHVREKLGRSIVSRYLEGESQLHVMTLNPSVQQALIDSIEPTQAGPRVNFDPGRAQGLIRQLAEAMERLAGAGHQPVLICPGRLRLPLRRLIERALPALTVLAYAEIPPSAQVRSAATVSERGAASAIV